MVLPAHLVKEVILVHLDHLVKRVNLDRLDQQVQADNPDHQDLVESAEMLVNLEKPVKEVNEVQMDLKGNQVEEVLQALLDLLDLVVHQANVDQQVIRDQ